jgi:hypothetical protein
VPNNLEGEGDFSFVMFGLQTIEDFGTNPASSISGQSLAVKRTENPLLLLGILATKKITYEALTNTLQHIVPFINNLHLDTAV